MMCVLAGAFLNFFLIVGALKCAGIFFVAFQDRFRTTSETTSVILSVQYVANSVTTLFVMTAGMKLMTIRTTVLIGAFFNCFVFVVTAVANNVYLVVMSHGLLFGAASSFVHGPTRAIIGQYFNKNRGLANSVIICGAGVGGLVFPPILHILAETFGYMGSFLITGGLLFHVLISGALFRPVENYNHLVKLETEQDSCKKGAGSDDNPLNDNKSVTGDMACEYEECTILADIGRESQRKSKIYKTANKHSTTRMHFSYPLRMVSTLFDLELLKDPVFLTLLFSQTIICAGIMLVTSFFAPHAKDVGCSDSQIAYLFSIINGLDAVASLMYGLIADKVKFDRAYIECFTASCICVLTQFIQFYADFVSVLLFAVVLGMLRSSALVMVAVLYVDFLGPKGLKGALGYNMLLEGTFQAVLYPIIGRFRDMSGSYHGSFHLLGIIIMIGTFLMVTAVKLKQRARGARNDRIL